MKSYQFAEHTIFCGHAGQWEQLIGACAQDKLGTVVDLRTFLEIGDQLIPKAPEGWGYRRLPVTGATVSEQDLDVFRREFYRKPQTVVVGPNPTRAQLMVAASLARLEKGGFEGNKRAEGDSEGEYQLLEWLTAYLVRHGYEKASVLEAVQSRRPVSSKPVATPKPKAAEPQPVNVAEPSNFAPAAEAEEPPTSLDRQDEASVELEPTAEIEMEPSVEIEPSVEVESSSEVTSAAAKGKSTRASSKGKAKDKPARAKSSAKRKK
jgi:hypothetical protein